MEPDLFRQKDLPSTGTPTPSSSYSRPSQASTKGYHGFGDDGTLDAGRDGVPPSLGLPPHGATDHIALRSVLPELVDLYDALALGTSSSSGLSRTGTRPTSTRATRRRRRIGKP